MPVAPDYTGHVLARRYALQSVIGDGGFGRVYRAVDRRLDTVVAVKVINPWWAADPEWVERLGQEARTAAQVQHPGVVRVTDTGTDPTLGPFTVAELIDGPSLRTLLDRDGKLPVDRAIELTRQAADALAAAHARGIVHRDVKPANLLLDAQGRVRVCDFGIARLQSGATRTSASHTVVGTPHYMAPEQTRGKAVGPAVDQYALAVVLYELLTGKPPFDGELPFEIALAHVSDPAPPLPRSVPEPVRAAVLKALAKAPADRHRDIKSFAQALVVGADPPETVPLGSELPTQSLTETSATPSPLRRRVLRLAVVACATATPIPTPERVKVPALIGVPESSARSRAERRGLVVIVTRRHSLRTGGGLVTWQRPDKGRRLKEGDTLRLTVSMGPPPVRLPSLKGSSSGAAQQRLAALGLTSSVREVPSSENAGTVLRTQPTAGHNLPRGSTVTLVIARAKYWHSVGTYTLDSDGATPSFQIDGERWRIIYTAEQLDCEFDSLGCDGPSMHISETSGGYGSDLVNLSEGTHTTYGPDGPGKFRLEITSYLGEWKVTARVEQLS